MHILVIPANFRTNNMKTLFLVRHAKSSWKHEGLKDIDRPLKKRGIRNAEFMAKILKKSDNIPEVIISSTAIRAYDTSKLFAEEFGIEDIIVNEQLYMADYDDFISVIKDVPGGINRLMIFSHNPGITYLASTLGKKDIENIPTCGIVRIDFECSHWNEVKAENGIFIFFEYPKKYE